MEYWADYYQAGVTLQIGSVKNFGDTFMCTVYRNWLLLTYFSQKSCI